MVLTWCSVPLCKNLASPHKDHQFYPFPENPHLRSIWVQRTHYYKEIVGREAVCCLHFVKNSFEYCKKKNSYVLKSDAVPCQYLPKTGESESFPFTPNKGRITKQDAGLHYSELVRKLRKATVTTIPRPKQRYLSKQDLEARKKLKDDPYLREYVLKQAFPNLNYDVLSSMLKRFSDPSGTVAIHHSSARHVISLTYQTTADLEASNELNPRNMVQLAADESYALRMQSRELADELDFTGQVSFSEKFPNIYRDNYFDNWPSQRRKRGRTAIDQDDDADIDHSKIPPYVVCHKCCKLIPCEMAPTHLQLCVFRMSQCTTCYAGFLSPKELQEHVQESHPEALQEDASLGPFQCGKCGKTFRKLVLLKQHIAEHQSGKKETNFECGLCTSVHQTAQALAVHFIESHGLRQSKETKTTTTTATRPADESLPVGYKCGFCGAAFTQPQQVADHLKQMHMGELAKYAMQIKGGVRSHSFPITDINIPTTEQQQLPPALSSTKPVVKKKTSTQLTAADMGGPEGTFDIFLCKQCPARYRTLNDFMAHSNRTNHQLLRNCTFCETAFTDEASYNKHINTHNPELLFRCTRCIGRGDSFPTLEDLIQHRKKRHPKKPAPIFKLCEICKKGVYIPTMTQHRAYHRSNMQVQCGECDAMIPAIDQKLHAQRHKNERNTLRKCRFCNVFEAREMLSEHEAIYHPEEDPYSCALCATKCNTQELLKRHAATSHNPNEFKSLGPCLYKTIEVEDAEYYECRICLIDYIYRSDMVKHIRVDHLNRTRSNTCTICGRIFRRERTLLTHLKKLECQPGQNLPLVKKPCYFCKKWLLKQDHEAHFKREHPRLFPVECVLCGQCYYRQEQLHQHVAQDHSCEERGTFVSTQRGFQVFNDGKYQYFECRLCGAEFTHKESCEEHLQTHLMDQLLTSDVMEVDDDSDVIEEDED